MKRTVLLLIPLLGLIALSCRDGGESASSTTPAGQVAAATAEPTKTEPLPAGLANAATHQDVPTYDGSGQVVHPDIAYFLQGWHGYKYWMAGTPNYYDRDGRANPHGVGSDGGSSWEAPPRLTDSLGGFPPRD